MENYLSHFPLFLSLMEIHGIFLCINCHSAILISDMNWMVITFAMLGKLAIAASFGMSWIYSIEVYPTAIRAIGVNMCSSFARFASVPASYMKILVKELQYFCQKTSLISMVFSVIHVVPVILGKFIKAICHECEQIWLLVRIEL